MNRAAAVCATDLHAENLLVTDSTCIIRFPIENAVVSLGMSFTLPWQLVMQIVVSMVMNRGRVQAYLHQIKQLFLYHMLIK